MFFSVHQHKRLSFHLSSRCQCKLLEICGSASEHRLWMPVLDFFRCVKSAAGNCRSCSLKEHQFKERHFFFKKRMPSIELEFLACSVAEFTSFVICGILAGSSCKLGGLQLDCNSPTSRWQQKDCCACSLGINYYELVSRKDELQQFASVACTIYRNQYTEQHFKKATVQLFTSINLALTKYKCYQLFTEQGDISLLSPLPCWGLLQWLLL